VGARCARTTAPTAPPGSTSPTIRHVRAPTAGARDGIAGISDEQQQLCFAVALWNGADPILKERMFGLTGKEGNHSEDVKECYFYLDNVPTHAYMKLFYEYFQGDSGAGLGASHQTGWTGAVARLIHQYAEYALQRSSPNAIEQGAVIMERGAHPPAP
jgi:hypothetical protein